MTREADVSAYQRLVSMFCEGASTVAAPERPKAIIVAGAPISWRYDLSTMSFDELRGRAEGCVVSDPGFIRQYHPRFDALRGMDRRMADALYESIVEDCSRWAAALVALSVERRFNLLCVSSLSVPDDAVALCEMLQEARYESELRALSVPDVMSFQQILQSYLKITEEGAYAPRLTKEDHDELIDGMSRSVNAISKRRLVDAVQLYGSPQS